MITEELESSRVGSLNSADGRQAGGHCYFHRITAVYSEGADFWVARDECHRDSVNVLSRGLSEAEGRAYGQDMS